MCEMKCQSCEKLRERLETVKSTIWDAHQQGKVPTDLAEWIDEIIGNWHIAQTPDTPDSQCKEEIIRKAQAAAQKPGPRKGFDWSGTRVSGEDSQIVLKSDSQCKTCGDTKEVCIDWPDCNGAHEVTATKPCPDCPQKEPGDLCSDCSAWTPEKYNKCSEPCKEYTEAIREAKQKEPCDLCGGTGEVLGPNAEGWGVKMRPCPNGCKPKE